MKTSSIFNNLMKTEFIKNAVTNIRLTVKQDLIPLFFSMLGQGFILKTRTGISVRDLLCRQIGISDDYLDQRIQTIFLDGKVVDNIDTALIRQGSSLALSAALPGLAGATLRRGGVYASMRSQISHKNDAEEDFAEHGTVMLKLFNLVALELGPVFLKQGICIDGKNLENFFRKVPDFFRDGCLSAEINDISNNINDLLLNSWEGKQVFLTLALENE
jgi:hypothetical protein